MSRKDNTNRIHAVNSLINTLGTEAGNDFLRQLTGPQKKALYTNIYTELRLCMAMGNELDGPFKHDLNQAEVDRVNEFLLLDTDEDKLLEALRGKPEHLRVLLDLYEVNGKKVD